MNLKENTLLQGGKYRILGLLGQGGFGITYLALQAGLNREVVIKEFFMRELCDRVEGSTRVSLGTRGSRESVALYLDKFLKEARGIATLKHANIISIHDVFEENDTAYYVMEYHGAGSLGSLVDNRGALNEEDALFYIRQVAAALKYVHTRRMMHLDIKPDNILIDEDGNAVLIDFGLSKHYNEKGKATSAASTYGTSPGYTPMEQYGEGGVGEFSPATDIYSLGATLFTLLTGEIPPPALRLVDSRSLQSDLAEKNVSGAVAEAIIKSMSFMKEARPQSIDEFLALLDAQLAVGGSSRLTQPMVKSGSGVSRPTQQMVKNGGVSRPTTPMHNNAGGSVSNDNGGDSGNKEPKKHFNWKITAGIIVAILCVVFAGVGINNCNNDRTGQQRLAKMSKAKSDAAKNTAVKQATEKEEGNDSTAAEKPRFGKGKSPVLEDSAVSAPSVPKNNSKKSASNTAAAKPKEKEDSTRKVKVDPDDEKAESKVEIANDEETTEALSAIYQVVEQQPEFPGGMQALMKFLRDNIQYPRISRENNSQGKAYVNFVVNTDGSIQDVEIMKSSSDVYLDREAVRVVKSMPKWNPGKNKGEAVRVRFTLPVSFRLQ